MPFYLFKVIFIYKNNVLYLKVKNKSMMDEIILVFCFDALYNIFHQIYL